MEFTEDLKLLCSHIKLERDKGVLALKSKLLKHKKQEGATRYVPDLEQLLLHFLIDPPQNCQWEEVFGHIQASIVLLESLDCTTDFSDRLQTLALNSLEHSEFRVRIIAGELLGSLCCVVNTEIYQRCETQLLQSIRKNLIRDLSSDALSETPKDAKDIFHDTAGWKSLETSMKGLQAIIEGCGEKFLDYMNFELLDLIFETLEHTNRFVRETGYYLCASLARYGVSSKEASNWDMANKLANHLQTGLADNWSQVRLAASVATRQFFQDMTSNDRKKFFPLLLPPMCLNRYYLAEGVKLYNQETWRLILGNEGKANVEIHIVEIVDFYIAQTECDNHAVREAACHCMAELGSKINHEVVKPYVPRILDALHVCFKDDSWPVRDTACVASGNFIFAFPEESNHLIAVLYPLFFANLGDPIPSVRQGAAVALTNVARAYNDEALSFIFAKVNDGLKQMKDQKATSERYEGLDKGVATYGVIKQLRDNDFDLHSNQTMYSCGSLAPKMRRGGCMDHSFKRASEPWEVADGCVYLVSEMSNFPKAHVYVQESINLIVDASHFKHYTHHLHFYETISKILPVIAKGLGKRVFKQYIESFFDLLFYSISCENALTRTAAIECIQILSNLIGHNILKGRVEQYNSAYIQTLETVLREQDKMRPYGVM